MATFITWTSTVWQSLTLHLLKENQTSFSDVNLYKTRWFYHRWLLYTYATRRHEGEANTFCDSCLCAVTFLLPEEEKVLRDLVVGLFFMWEGVEWLFTWELLPEDPTDWFRGASFCLGVEWSPFMDGDKLPRLLGAEEHISCWWGRDCLLRLYNWGCWRGSFLHGDKEGTLSGTWEGFIEVSWREDATWGQEWFMSLTSFTGEKKTKKTPHIAFSKSQV